MGQFKEAIDAMYKQANRAGLKWNTLRNFFRQFDAYCEEHYPEQQELTKEIALEWVFAKKLSKNQLNNKLLVIKHLGKYLLSTGQNAYVPNFSIKRDPAEPVTLLDKEDLHQFFEAVDHWKPSKRCPYKEYLLPVLFRLEYLCGLRNSECCNLKREDVDLINGILLIRGSKKDKDRRVYVSDSFLEFLRRFDAKYDEILPGREYFLERIPYREMETNKYCNRQIWRDYEAVLKKCSLLDKYPKKPTPHGFRHLFIVNSFKQAIAQGKDVNHYIKFLATYVGHDTTQELYYYLHSIPMLAEEISKHLEGLTFEKEIFYEED